VCPHAQIQQEKVSPAKTIRCVLVHDHVLLRQGLRRLLEDAPELEVVSEAGDVTEALQHVLEHQPEVVIADARTMGLAPQDAERLILRESPHSRILFLGMHEASDATLNDIEVVGSRCTVRHTSAEELVEMVRDACQTGVAPVREMPRGLHGSWVPENVSLPRRRVLTAREREVLKLLAEGRTVRSAAGVLGLSSKTVDAHKFNLMRKLGLHNKAELVMWAIQQKVVKIPVGM
jgi:two-component system, NarL family, response regulator NreC